MNFTMKTSIKIAGIWAALSLVMYFGWMAGFALGTALFPSELQQADAEPERVMVLLLLVCAINTAALLLFMLKSRKGGLILFASTALLIFGVQFFLSQIETLWFNDALQLPLMGIAGIVAGGLIMSLIFSTVAVPVVNGLRKQLTFHGTQHTDNPYRNPQFWTRLILLAIIVYPMLYMLAGYYIAWQAPAVRTYYTGNPELTMTFLESLLDNIRSGLIPFQFMRGFLWIIIGLPVLNLYEGHLWQKAVVLGLIYALIMNSWHLLPNPYFPDELRFVHFIETASSNFIWGVAVAFVLGPYFSPKALPFKSAQPAA